MLQCTNPFLMLGGNRIEFLSPHSATLPLVLIERLLPQRLACEGDREQHLVRNQLNSIPKASGHLKGGHLKGGRLKMEFRTDVHT